MNKPAQLENSNAIYARALQLSDIMMQMATKDRSPREALANVEQIIVSLIMARKYEHLALPLKLKTGIHKQDLPDPTFFAYWRIGVQGFYPGQRGQPLSELAIKFLRYIATKDNADLTQISDLVSSITEFIILEMLAEQMRENQGKVWHEFLELHGLYVGMENTVSFRTSLEAGTKSALEPHCTPLMACFLIKEIGRLPNMYRSERSVRDTTKMLVRLMTTSNKQLGVEGLVLQARLLEPFIELFSTEVSNPAAAKEKVLGWIKAIANAT